MKKIKKLLTSTLSLGLVLGNMGGTVVEATSALRDMEVPVLRQLEKQSKKKEKLEEQTLKEKTEDSLSTSALGLGQSAMLTAGARIKKIQENTPVLTDYSSAFDSAERNREEIRIAVGNQIQRSLDRAMSNTSASQFKDTEITFERITQRGWNFDYEDTDIAPSVGEFVQDNLLFLYSDRDGLGSGLWSVTTDSTCGNWRLRVYAAREGTSVDHIFARITRVRWGSLNTTKVDFNLPILLSYGEWFSSPPYFRDVTLSGTTRPISIEIPGTLQSHGVITATAKTGPHVITQNDTLPAPSTYITTGNTVGRVTIDWKDGKVPNTSSVGQINGEITVTDETGRTANVSVPITVQPAPLQVTPKAGTNEIYQYSKLPTPEDYFEVINFHGTHRLEWIEASTQVPGTYTWRVKATTSDGREATSSTTMEVLPHSGIELKLKDIEDRNLGMNYDSLASNFREYIEEASMFGEAIDFDQLEFVAAESTEPDYSTVGKQKVRITVQKKHPDSDVMVKGTAETSINIRWGDTFLLKAHDGRSAGAYAFQLRNGNNARIVATRGLDSPLDERIGLEDSLYYSIEVLRNDQQAYYHEVPGRATLQQVITTFGNGNGYLDVQLGDIINIHHPQKSAGSSVLMVEEEEQDFTYGTDNAYYRVTAFGFEPLPVLPDPAIQLKLKPMEDRTLGETSASLASTFKNYIEEATFEGESVAIDDLEFVAAESTEPTNTIAGKQDIRITVQAKHPISGETIKGTAETSVNYLWGDTFMIKSSEGGSAGAYSLHLRSGNAARLTVTSGLPSALDERVGTEESMHALYYSLEVFSLMDDVSTLDVKELVKDVTINHQSISEDRYTIEQVSEIDTSTTGKRTTKVKITMNDGLAETEIEVPYEVQWGSTFVLRGLEEMTVGAFSLLKEGDQFTIHASPGSSDTDLNRPVNNPFGRGIYYAIEVLENDTRKYNYEVTGNTLIRQAVNGFNSGQPLAVNVGDTIKVYHAETQGRNLLMMDEMVRDYTGGSNYAYYKVTEEGFEPFTDIKADPISQELLLGHETNTVDPAELIQNVTFNGRPLTSDLYTVEQLSNFDTTTVGEKGVRVRVSTTDGTGFTEVKIPYVVKWGSTIRVKNNDGATIGAFSLIKQTNPNNQNTQMMIRASQGVANTELSKVVHDYSDRSIYYQFDVMNKYNTTSRFTYDVTGNRTIEQALSRFNSGQPLNVNIGDIVRIYHTKEFRRNMLMEDEQEKNFTYGSQYAYYEVTEYGFEPSGKIDVEANKVEIPRGATDLDLKSFIKNVKVNDKVIPENLYTVSLNSEIDTSTPGRNNVAVNVTTDSSYGGFSTELNMPYEVRDHTTNSSTKESQNNHTNNEDTSGSTERNEGTTPSIQDDPTTSADNESSLNMPQTNATRNTAWTLIGIALVAGIGAIVMRRKTKEKAENQ